MDGILFSLSVIKIVTLGLAILFLAAVGRAYRIKRSASLMMLFLAILLFTIGVGVEGILVQVFQTPLAIAHLVEGITTLSAFLVLFLSVRME